MVRANTAEGVLPNDKVNEIRDWLADPVAYEAQLRPPNVDRG